MSNSFEKLNRVPPSMPTVWQECNPILRTMSMAQRGIYFSIMLHLWVYDTLPWDVWQLAKTIGSDYRTTAKLLQKCGDLAVCVRCSCGWRAETLHCPCSDLAVTVHNIKLKNYKVDVNSKLPLGTTEPNPTLTQPKVTPPSAQRGAASSGGGKEEENSTNVVEGYFDQEAPNPLVEKLVGLLGMVNPLAPRVYGEWSRRLENLQDGVGVERYSKAIAYLFANPMYCRGIKTCTKDKVLWLMEKWEPMLAKMDSDAEFAKNKPEDNRPQYRKNPSGGSGFGKTVA
jgi:hypothetical protein